MGVPRPQCEAFLYQNYHGLGPAVSHLEAVSLWDKFTKGLPPHWMAVGWNAAMNGWGLTQGPAW